ncbi:MAG: homoserine O- acetyltransferase [Vezdaea aestivalis]|nr:MAG: homoserine O- acetyltransferase [Vezdaea aestivalis]
MHHSAKYEHVTSAAQTENPFASLVSSQHIAIIPSLQLECGATLKNAPIAYSIRGTLSPNRDNVMVICHALTGSADVSDWWGPLLGTSGRAFDTSRFYIICFNSLGSPYGSASPVTAIDGDASLGRYGPEFPLTTIRDDVRAHRLVLDDLGVRRVAVVIGGSMGGMLVLEWAYFGKDYVRAIVPIATASRHSAWGISWGEAQRQSIYSDPKYQDGHYSSNDPPASGLGAARMAALLTYRSRNSFESRFGRNVPDITKRKPLNPANLNKSSHWVAHNEGHRTAGALNKDSAEASRTAIPHSLPTTPEHGQEASGNNQEFLAKTKGASTEAVDPQFSSAGPLTVPVSASGQAPTYFSAQSYLRYQGDKFVSRFDSNCYIALTRKMDTHDVSRDRIPQNTDISSEGILAEALALIAQPTLILGISSDGLFTFAEQEELASHIPNARLETIDSPEGHDAFLLQFEQVNRFILAFLREIFPEIMDSPGVNASEGSGLEGDSVGSLTKSSTFGEAEVGDITACLLAKSAKYIEYNESEFMIKSALFAAASVLQVLVPPQTLDQMDERPDEPPASLAGGLKQENLPVKLVHDPIENILWNIGPMAPIFLDPEVGDPVACRIPKPSRYASPLAKVSRAEEDNRRNFQMTMTGATQELYTALRQSGGSASEAIMEHTEDGKAAIAYLRKDAGLTELETRAIGKSYSIWLDAKQPRYRLDYPTSITNPPVVPTSLRTEVDFRRLDGISFSDENDELKQVEHSEYFVINKAAHVMRINGFEIGHNGIAGPLKGFCVIELGEAASVLFWRELDDLDYTPKGTVPSTANWMCISDSRYIPKPLSEDRTIAEQLLSERLSTLAGKNKPVSEFAKAMGYVPPGPNMAEPSMEELNVQEPLREETGSEVSM